MVGVRPSAEGVSVLQCFGRDAGVIMALYDDTLRNLMKLLEEDSPANRSMLFRHLCDLIVQNRPISRDSQRAGLIALIDRMRPSVEPLARMEVAEQLCSVSNPPFDLARILARDDITIARWILDRAKLDDKDWLTLIPELDEAGLNRLAKREGLSPPVREAVLDALEPSNGQLDAGSLSRSEQQIEALLGRLGKGAKRKPPLGLKATNPVKTESIAGHKTDHAAELFLAVPDGQNVTISDSVEDSSDDPRLFGADALWESDRFNLFTFVSSAVPEILGIKAEKVAGQAFDLLLDLPPDIISRLRDQRPFDGVAPLTTDSSSYWAINAIPVFDNHLGAFQGFRGTLRRLPDFAGTSSYTDQKDKFQERRKPADVAHEIRTPLNAIRGFAEMIQSEIWGPVSPAYRDRSSRIINEAGRLDSLVTDLLDAGRLEEGRLETESSACDIHLLIEDSLSHLSNDERALITLIEKGRLMPVWGEFRLLSRVVGKFFRIAACWHPAGRALEIELLQSEDRRLRLSTPLPLYEGGMEFKDLMTQPRTNKHILLATALGYGLGPDFAAQIADLFGGEMKLVQSAESEAKLQLFLNSST